jgi:DNA topoisomerase I
MAKILRVKAGRGFQYIKNGEPITDKEELKYFRSLKIPPAWTDVNIAVSKKARILATGKDKAGRKQYIYHPEFRAKQEEAKFNRILKFAEALPHMRHVTRQHLKRKRLDKKIVLASGRISGWVMTFTRKKTKATGLRLYVANIPK